MACVISRSSFEARPPRRRIEGAPAKAAPREASIEAAEAPAFVQEWRANQDKTANTYLIEIMI